MDVKITYGNIPTIQSIDALNLKIKVVRDWRIYVSIMADNRDPLRTDYARVTITISKEELLQILKQITKKGDHV